MARAVQYKPSRLAKRLGTSLRSLQRFLQMRTGKPARAWLNELRQSDALLLLVHGKTVKEAAHILGYKQVSHFCREFKRFHRVTPGSIRQRHLIVHRLTADVFPVLPARRKLWPG